MLQAIDSALDHICLTSYIFDTDETGRRFIDALGRAVERGVTVRVLIDGVGEWYSWPRASSLLRRAGVDTARFLPPRLVPPSRSINLRNHNKILVLDDPGGATSRMTHSN